MRLDCVPWLSDGDASALFPLCTQLMQLWDTHNLHHAKFIDANKLRGMQHDINPCPTLAAQHYPLRSMCTMTP